MQNTLGVQIGLMRFFRRSKIAYAPRFAVDAYAGAPFALVRDYADKARLVSFIWLAYILRIATSVYNSKVAEPIVRFCTVYVVNKSSRPFTGNVQPRQPMRFKYIAANAYGHIADFVNAPCHIANVNAFCGSFFPNKKPRVGVVIKNFSQVFCGKILLAHAVVPLKRWYLKLVFKAPTLNTSAYINTGII